MQNLLSLWSALSARRRVIVVAATLAMFLAVLSLTRIASTPSLSLLYSGLDSAAAGEVVAALEQRGVAYEIRGDAIHVDAAQRDSLRMLLASEGLPANSGSGYELLDSLSGFGTTSQMFDAAYWRGKEGELARTILANPQIRAARVHIAQAPSQPFQRDLKPTASVTVTTVSGGLPALQVKALRHLVAAAVAGMQPDDVAVIDALGGLIPSETGESAQNSTGDARSAEIRKNVERLLAARVGPGKAVVEVAVEVATEREAVTERVFDPRGRVAISSETEANSDSNTSPGGDVTVASNLPAGDAAAGNPGKSESTGTKERINYEVSETNREILRLPGTIKKISVAVLVDDREVTAADGTVTTEPRTEEELGVLRELVASAVGLDESRGDVLTLKSLAFAAEPQAGVLAEAGMLSNIGPFDVMSLIQLGVLALVALVLGLFVIRPVLTSPARKLAELPAPVALLALPGMTSAAGGSQALSGEIDDGGRLSVFEFDPDMDAVARLRQLIEDRGAESVEILRGWMEQDEERVG